MPKELQTLTLLGVVQSQASAPGCGAALLGQVAPACRRVPVGQAVLSLGSAGRAFSAGTGRRCLWTWWEGPVGKHQCSHSENDCSEDLTSFREV